MENHTIVTLKKGEGRTIKAGGAWIFDNEIDTITGTFTNGDIVVVHDFDGYPMGRGFINQNSKIRIRMMTRKADQLIDDNFLRMRVQNALFCKSAFRFLAACGYGIKRFTQYFIRKRHLINPPRFS